MEHLTPFYNVIGLFLVNFPCFLLLTGQWGAGPCFPERLEDLQNLSQVV
jgi:hypothetical protein